MQNEFMKGILDSDICMKKYRNLLFVRKDFYTGNRKFSYWEMKSFYAGWDNYIFQYVNFVV